MAAELAELKRRCEVAEAASRARAGFLAMTSHEIREPMNGVIGMCRLLRDTPLDDEQRGYLDSALDSAEALLTLINDILDLSRIDAGRIDLAPIPVDLAAFVDRLGRHEVRGVPILPPRHAAKLSRAEGPLEPAQVGRLADELARRLPPA